MQNKITYNDISVKNESRVKDFFALLKPRVMSLVVFTGIVGMYLAPGEIHLFMAFIATMCIALGSGAAGAVNMWYERDVDLIMKRTQNRPLPAGRIAPEPAIEFAIVAAFISVFVMAVVVNFVAAALLLSAILFYVFVYTIWLKRKTPQNIVIGGAAGAFPPMIGWAAVTGSVSAESVILFLIIFLWTPPHFWALALYKNEDYTRAKIPMMPVIKGSEQTRKKMLKYTVMLFMVSLFPAVFEMFGTVYAIGAGVLGVIFLYKVLGLAILYSEERSRSVFKFSLVYLAGLFLIMVLDKAVM